MNAYLVLASVFGIFLPALILPGPDFVGVMRSSMTRGAAAGLLTSLGVSVGLALYATLGLLGLSALMIRFEWLAWAIRVAGGAYLVYLGVKLILAKPVELEIREGGASGTRGAFLFGLGVTLTNPKAIVLFASVFATAVTPQTPSWLLALMVGLVFAASLTWYAIVSLFISSPAVARIFAKARHRIERVAGGCFVLIGGRILVDSRNPLTP